MHVISIKQFLDRSALAELFKAAAKFQEKEKGGTVEPMLGGRILATLFYEPSTRTCFSFESAMLRLGGAVISTESAGHFSSATKGETLADTIRIISGYADAIVLRHPEKGSAAEAASVSSVPIINAGDGPGEHPTQALLDLYTIQRELGDISGKKIAMVGDLKYGRTIHSLLPLISLYENVSVSLVSPPALSLPEEDKEKLRENNMPFTESSDLASVAAEADVIYMTRIQKERLQDQDEYEKLKDACVLQPEILARVKEKAIIMHPLPRVNEIPTEIDKDPRAAYFRQAENGLYVRMALLMLVFGK